MVQLELRTAEGRTTLIIERLPVVLGRSPECDHVVDAPGVWAQHCRLLHAPSGKYQIQALGESIVVHNGIRVSEANLRNGDQLRFGAAEAIFALSPVSQRSLLPTELPFWAVLLIVGIAQLALMTALF